MRSLACWIAAVATGLLLASPASAQDPMAIAKGAGVYATNCARCHNLRPPAERSDSDWSVIVAHMRSRANLTRTDARAVLTFLQATNGVDGVETAAPPADRTTPVRTPVADAQSPLLVAYLQRLRDAARRDSPP